MDVGAMKWAALFGLLLVWASAVAVRRRAARREETQRQRRQARRRAVPVVSANLRGLPRAHGDLWDEAREDPAPGRPGD